MTKIEYTKTEQRILSPNFEKKIKIVLWVGILCICISLLLVPSFMKRIDKIEKRYTEIQNDITKIQTETKHEAKLKKLLIDGATREKEYLLKFATERTFRPIALLFIIGCLCIANYLSTRMYLKLIRKLQKS